MPTTVIISDIHVPAPAEQNNAGQYVELKNAGDTDQDLTEYYISIDYTADSFTFPVGTTLAPGATLRVYANEIHPETGAYSFGLAKLFNPYGSDQSATLFDPDGESTQGYVVFEPYPGGPTEEE